MKNKKSTNSAVNLEKPPKPGIFKKGFDPRRNLSGRPKTGEALADHIRDLLDSPMKRKGTEEEITALDAGLIALAEAFIAGDPAVAKLLLDRGWGKLPEMIMLSQKDRETKADYSILPSEVVQLMVYWAWQAAGSPAPDSRIEATTRKEYEAIQKAIDDSQVLDLVKSYTSSLSNPASAGKG